MRNPRKKISRELLQQLYWGDGLLQTQIAQRLGYGPDVVHDAMKRFGLATRSPAESARLARGVCIPETELRKLYE